jgi:hypothetical protein
MMKVRDLIFKYGAGQGGGGSVSPLMNGLLSYWKLDETGGNRLDTVGTRHMVPSGGVGYQPGKLGNCVTFSGAEDTYLTTAADASLLAVNWAGGFTFAGWFYIPTAFTNTFSVLSRKYDVCYLAVNGLTSVSYRVYDAVSGNSTATVNPGLQVDTWNFAAGRYNPNTKKSELSVNGSAWAVGGVALGNGPKNTSDYLEIGRWGSAFGASWVDSVGLWGRYLSNDEVAELYNSGNGLEHPF